MIVVFLGDIVVEARLKKKIKKKNVKGRKKQKEQKKEKTKLKKPCQKLYFKKASRTATHKKWKTKKAESMNLQTTPRTFDLPSHAVTCPPDAGVQLAEGHVRAGVGLRGHGGQGGAGQAPAGRGGQAEEAGRLQEHRGQGHGHLHPSHHHHQDR